MTIKVGLMGFGRIGRNFFRVAHKDPQIEIKAISDVADHKGLEYLLRYDTLMGRFPGEVRIHNGVLHCDDQEVEMLSGRDPGDVDWERIGVDVVVEATAKCYTRAELQKHLDKGAPRLLLCVPPIDEPDVTIIMGTNHSQLRSEHRIISNTSMTVNCAAPVLALLDEAFSIERVFFTAIHAYTNDQHLADVPTKDLRSGRAASENIVPTEIKAGLFLERLFTHLAGRIEGLALKVPVPNGSLVDMTMFCKKPLSAESVNAVMREGIKQRYAEYVEYTEDPIVSSDVKRSPYSSTFDALATTVVGEHLVKTVSWYDNGWGYAHRIKDLLVWMEQVNGGRP
jgi:glyceraldehyde 3-phosphate dehydrogenase